MCVIVSSIRKGPSALYAQDVSFSEHDTTVEAIRIQSEYVRLTKLNVGNDCCLLVFSVVLFLHTPTYVDQSYAQ